MATTHDASVVQGAAGANSTKCLCLVRLVDIQEGVVVVGELMAILVILFLSGLLVLVFMERMVMSGPSRVVGFCVDGRQHFFLCFVLFCFFRFLLQCPSSILRRVFSWCERISGLSGLVIASTLKAHQVPKYQVPNNCPPPPFVPSPLFLPHLRRASHRNRRGKPGHE